MNGFKIQDLIDYLEKTSEDSWLVDKVRSKDDAKNCVMGHIFDFGGGDNPKGAGSDAWDFFEAAWATTYMIYPVNDGSSPQWMNYKYNQPTPKQRCVAYLKNLRDGKEKTTSQLMDEQYQKYLTLSNLNNK